MSILTSMPTAGFDRGDHAELAEALVTQLAEHGDVVFDDGELHRYDITKGIYAPIPQHEQSQAIQAFAGTIVGSGKKARPLTIRRNDVVGVRQNAWDLAARPEFFAGATAGLAFVDCFVRVSKAAGIEVLEHSPDHRAKFAMPFAYEHNAEPDRLIEFFDEVFRDDPDIVEKVELVQEYAGLALLGNVTDYQCALVLKGAGANGKSVLVSVLEACFPPGSTSAIPPQDWANEYRAAMISGKRLNVVSELPESDILRSETFKAIITGDSTTGRHIRESPFTFRARAGHLLAANRLPSTDDSSWGFWRRLVVLVFNRIFEEPEQNKHLADEIIEHERPVIVAWLIEGALRALRQGRLTIPSSSANAIAEWKKFADSVRAFVEECCTPLPQGAPLDQGTPAKQLYRTFCVWCEDNGHRPVASNKFGARLALLRDLPPPWTGSIASAHTERGNVYPLRCRSTNDLAQQFQDSLAKPKHLALVSEAKS